MDEETTTDPTMTKLLALLTAIAAHLGIAESAEGERAEGAPPAEPKTDAIHALAHERLGLLEHARRVVPNLRIDATTSNDEIRRKVLARLDGAASVEGVSAERLRGLFDGRMRGHSVQALAKARADATYLPRADEDDDADYIPSITDAWRYGPTGGA